MSSVQSVIVKTSLKLRKGALLYYTSKPERFDAIRLRTYFDKITSKVGICRGVTMEMTAVAGIKAAWLTPETYPQEVVFLYLHGGGYGLGSIHSHKGLVSKMVQQGRFKALMLDYRLAPEHPFPAAVEDTIIAYKYLLEKGYLPENIIIGGDSAGGGLTISALTQIRDQQLPMPAAGVCLSPWTDLSNSGDSIITKLKADPMLVPPALEMMALSYVAQDRTLFTHPLVSPIFAELHQLPPLLIQVGIDEILLDDATRLAQKAKAADVKVVLEKWTNMYHVWQFFWPILPEAKAAIVRIGEFVRSKVTASFPNP